MESPIVLDMTHPGEDVLFTLTGIDEQLSVTGIDAPGRYSPRSQGARSGPSMRLSFRWTSLS
jgi:hypothetical protein